LITRAVVPILAAIAAVLLISALEPITSASAQDGRVITSGVVIGVEPDASGRLERFTLSDSDGNQTEYTVEDLTEYGLETQSGDRWVATHADNAAEAVSRLRDHQQRFAAIIVISQNGVALSVVERESGKLETNLSFLFAVFVITWAGFFAYIFFVSRKQRDLNGQVARLRTSMKRSTDE
jgi:CcmD family protein